MVGKALSDPSWVEAMQEELLQFKLQKVWILVDLPKGKRPISLKWIFKNKTDERGIVIRNKARLVAQGHTQEEGIDYDDVFASSINFTMYAIDMVFIYDELLCHELWASVFTLHMNLASIALSYTWEELLWGISRFTGPPSPDYIPGPEEPQLPPPLDYVPEPIYLEFMPQEDEEDDDEDPEEDPIDYPADGGDEGDDEDEPSEDDEEDDVDIEADDDEEEEEHPAHADSVVVSLPAVDQVLSAEETEPFKTDGSTATPPPHPTYRVTARISILAPVPTPAWSKSEVARLLTIPTPTPSPLSSCSLPLPQIPFPPLPLIPSPLLPLSPPLPVSYTPPASPIRSLSYRAAMIRLRAKAPSTSHSLLLPSTIPLTPPFRDSINSYHNNSFNITTLLTTLWLVIGGRPELVKSLKTQMTELQRQQGPAKGPAEPELPEEAGSVGRIERTTRECTYADFLKCQPLNFKGTEGVAGLSQWFERMESVFHISNCAVENQVKFATCTLYSVALTWWNTHVKTVGHDAAYESDKIEKYVGGLPETIYESVVASKPKTMQDAVEITTELMDKKNHTLVERLEEGKRMLGGKPKEHTEQNKNKRQIMARATLQGLGEKKSYGDLYPMR
ncbi:reverse transcriptase domain-containing protein [Tanacetum coccineum]